MILLVRHRVRDYGAWKPIFDEHQIVREKHGATRHWLYRSTEDPNDLILTVEFPTTEAAQGFVADPSLKEAMDRAGVEGPPTIIFCTEIETVSYTGVPA